MKKFVGISIFIAAIWWLTQFFAPGFWPELLGVITAMVVVLITNRGFKKKRLSSENFDRIIAGAMASGLILLSLNRYNSGLNLIPDIVWVIAIGIFIVGFSVVALSIANNRRNENYLHQERWWGRQWLSQDAKRDIVVTLSMAFSLTMALSIWANFGSLFIWVPIVFLSVATFFFIGSDDYLCEYESIGGALAITVIASYAVGIVSTAYQFWHPIGHFFEKFPYFFGLEVFWGIKLWYLIAGTALIASTVIAYVKISRAIKKSREAKRLAEERKKAKKEKEEKDAAIIRESEEKLANILQKESLSWNELLAVLEYDRYRVTKKLALFLCALPLLELIEVSTIKQQLVYNARLKNALYYNDACYSAIYDDNIIEKLINQTETLREALSPYREYKGYENIISEIDQHCGKRPSAKRVA